MGVPAVVEHDALLVRLVHTHQFHVVRQHEIESIREAEQLFSLPPSLLVLEPKHQLELAHRRRDGHLELSLVLTPEAKVGEVLLLREVGQLVTLVILRAGLSAF